MTKEELQRLAKEMAETLTRGEVEHKRSAAYSRMKAILDTGESRDSKSLSHDEMTEYTRLETEFDVTTEVLRSYQFSGTTVSPMIRDMLSQPDYQTSREGRMLSYGEKLSETPSGLSLAKTFRGLISGDWRGAEEEFRAIGIGAGGTALVPTALANEIFDLARAKVVAMKAGAQTFPMSTGEVDVPQVATVPTASWRNEHAAITPSEPTFTPVKLSAKSLSLLSVMSRELLQDSPMANDAVMSILAASMGSAIDKAILQGSGTSPEPRGILNTVGIQTITKVAGDTSLKWVDLIDAKSKILSVNREPQAAIMHPTRLANLAKNADGNGAWLSTPGYLEPVIIYETSAMPTNKVIVGDMRQVVYGLREGINFQMLIERYADSGQIGVVTHSRGDVVVKDPASFCVITIPAS